MRLTSHSKALEATAHATLVAAQIEANESDAAWQATLASMPKGVMHRN